MPFSDYDAKRLEQEYPTKKSPVEVKEDRLFEVDIHKMQLAPVYWKGAAYEVRRGTWFTTDGVPLPAETAAEIEAGYGKCKPYETKPEAPDFAQEFRKSPKEAMARFNDELKNNLDLDPIDTAKETDVVDLGDGQAAVFFDATQGAIFPRNISKFQLGVIRNMGPKAGSLMDVTTVQRGYTEALGSSMLDSVKSAPVPSLSDIILGEVASLFTPGKEQDSKLVSKDKEETLQKVLESDYESVEDPKESNRDVDHLVLCVHGIGQILGYKYESVNFTHSVNVMRNTMREVYHNEEKYQKLAHGEQYNPKDTSQATNNKIQILPISWRHEVTFNPRKEFGLLDDHGSPRLPSLGQINVDGVRPLRNIVGDVVLDVLLYYEPRYIKEIFQAVVTELNRVHALYMERNPDFKGKIHVLGHSLGSAISFDLLSCQDKLDNEYHLNFDVENLFCVGSPVGMFKLLQQKNIRPRSQAKPDSEDVDSPKCKNLYNVFHPCDPVSYRMEPLVNPKFAQFKAEEIPYALKGFNTQVRNITSFGDEVLEKIIKASSSWFRASEKQDSSKTLDQQALAENALGDIISTLASPGGDKKDNKRKTKQMQMSQQDITQLCELNRSGRIDYCLPIGMFSIALVSAISAHVSYFEDQEVAGFVMKEILSCDQETVGSKTVVAYT